MKMLLGTIFDINENVQMFIKWFSRSDAKILILSGSHGSEDGVSGLTVNNDKNVDEGYAFYKQDCKMLRIIPGPHKRSQRLPLRNWNGVPDITKPAEKDDNFFPSTLIEDMDIRVCNICYYNEQQEKFVMDVQEVRFKFQWTKFMIFK